MIKIEATLRLGHVRKAPIHTGYRPGFKFLDETMTSGQITLLDREELVPGGTAIVEVQFLSKEFLGDDLSPGRIITFGEGPIALGEIEIIDVMEIEE
ncbi:MAG: hypothetical protein KIT61_12305 [Pyrinomonadaceae bacterium]|nr:hypothetical protein [Pyrinomonadaceae bacterium]